MRRLFRPRWLIALGFALWAFACASSSPTTTPPPRDLDLVQPAEKTSAPNAEGTEPQKPVGPVELSVLITTDEHGWLEPKTVERDGQSVHVGGVGELYRRFVKDEALAPETLVLSGGDMWTGPYESTLLEGAPVVSAFNFIGYDAAALGNHEFDFGVRALEEREAQARFRFLAANLIEEATGRPPPFVTPYAVIEKKGLRIGVIGLCNRDTPSTTDRRHIVGLRFEDYTTGAARALNALAAEAVDVKIVLVHDRISNLGELLPLLRSHGVNILGAGHAHRSEARIDRGPDAGPADDVLICNVGHFLRSYCRIKLVVDKGALTAHSLDIIKVERPAEPPAKAAPELAAIIADAHAVADEAGNEVLVESVRAVNDKDAIGQLLVDSWLDAHPHAEVAITNRGGIRQGFPKGPVRVRDVFGALPFSNFLVIVELTGAQLKEALTNEESIAGGLTYRLRREGPELAVDTLVDRRGAAIEDDRVVRVVTSDFLFRGGDNYRFADYDQHPEETALDWRDPLLRKLRALKAQNGKLNLHDDGRAH